VGAYRWRLQLLQPPARLSQRANHPAHPPGLRAEEAGDTPRGHPSRSMVSMEEQAVQQLQLLGQLSPGTVSAVQPASVPSPRGGARGTTHAVKVPNHAPALSCAASCHSCPRMLRMDSGKPLYTRRAPLRSGLRCSMRSSSTRRRLCRGGTPTRARSRHPTPASCRRCHSR